MESDEDDDRKPPAREPRPPADPDPGGELEGGDGYAVVSSPPRTGGRGSALDHNNEERDGATLPNPPNVPPVAGLSPDDQVENQLMCQPVGEFPAFDWGSKSVRDWPPLLPRLGPAPPRRIDYAEPPRAAASPAPSSQGDDSTETKPKEKGPQTCRLCKQKRKGHICTFGKISIEKINLIRPLLQQDVCKKLDEHLDQSKATKREDDRPANTKGRQKCNLCGRGRKGHDCPFVMISHEMRQYIRQELPPEWHSIWDVVDPSDAEASQTNTDNNNNNNNNEEQPQQPTTDTVGVPSPLVESSLLDEPLPRVPESLSGTRGRDATNEQREAEEKDGHPEGGGCKQKRKRED